MALCGHWDHPPPCRWPHNNAIAMDGRRGRLRTVFAVIPEDEPMVRRRIEQGLRAGVGWSVVSVRPVQLTAGERDLGRRLSGAG